MPEREFEDDKTQTHVALTAGTTVLHYKIVEKIGAGGMGEVYLAEDTELDRKVALKFLPPHLCQDEDCRTRFKREAQAVAKLNHPNVITIYEVSEYQGRPFFAMEHIEGRSLRDLVKEKELGLGRVIDLSIQMSGGLREAHEAGIAHRDIKPSNIIVHRKGHAKLLDFGLAAVMGAEKLTKTGSTLGTVGYMSPEQARGQKMDHRSDLFSLGVVIYEAVTGRRPFKGEDEAATLHAVTHDTPQPLARYCTDATDDLQRIVFKLLEKDSGLRYQSAAGLISDLRKLKKESESGQSAAQPESSIAVLPFTNLSADPEQEYFCDGMAEEIINALTHVESLRVVARTSCFAFKGKHEDVREIGRKLDVETLLEGSVRKAGNRLRITAQLVTVADGSHVWSEKYDRAMEDVFAIQDEISLAIVEKLKPKLLMGKERKVIKRYTADPEAYNLYLKGKFFLKRRTEATGRKGMEHFQSAIAKDPQFPLPYVGLADAYFGMGWWNLMPKEDAYRNAREKVTKALEIDETIAEAHITLGNLRSYCDWDWTGAEQEFRRAIALNASDAEAHHMYSHFLVLMGRFEEAIREMKQALELEPISVDINSCFGQVLYYARRFSEAVKQLETAIEMDPSYFDPYDWLGLSHTKMDNHEQAIAVLKAGRGLAGAGTRTVAMLGYAYAAAGNTDEAQSILEELTDLSAEKYVDPYFVAWIYAGLNKRELAFELLQKACDEQSTHANMLKVDPLFDNLRSDRRFAVLLRKMRLD